MGRRGRRKQKASQAETAMAVFVMRAVSNELSETVVELADDILALACWAKMRGVPNNKR